MLSSDKIEVKKSAIFESVTDSKYICTPGVLLCSFIHIKPFMSQIKPNTKMLVKRGNFIHEEPGNNARPYGPCGRKQH